VREVRYSVRAENTALQGFLISPTHLPGSGALLFLQRVKVLRLSGVRCASSV
jgi:hypothetical protein